MRDDIDDILQEIKAAQREHWLATHLTPELQEVIDLGYLRHDAPESVAKAYRAYCQLFDKPCIWLRSGSRSGITLLMAITETMKPAQRVSRQVGKLRKAWAERLSRKHGILADELSAKEASMRALTEEQALALAGDLWAIVGQAGAYEHAEPAYWAEDNEEAE